MATAAWTREQALGIALAPANTPPVIDPATVPPALPGRLVWDCWPIRSRSGDLAEIDGRVPWMTLAVTDDVHPDDRHGVASLHFALVDGRGAWSYAGPVFEPGFARGTRQWAGDAVLDPDTGRLTVFYSAVGSAQRPGSYDQHIAIARGRLEASECGLTLASVEHVAILEPDGRWYRGTTGGEQREGFADAFRDPGYVEDPATGREYVLFEATMARSTSRFDGAIGIAETIRDELSEWRLLPPLLTAGGVNKELERPHIVVRGGRYYLFFSAHAWTFAPDIVAPEGLYGFVAETILGPYRPLNRSGLVLGNPTEEPIQAYSWLVHDDLTVSSFLDYAGLRGRWIHGDRELRRSLYGGRLAPTLRLEIEGDTTRVGAL